MSPINLSRLCARLVPLLLIASFVPAISISARAQDIQNVVVLPAAPDLHVVTPGTPDAVPTLAAPARPLVIVPVLSDDVFPIPQASEDVLTQRNDNNRTGTSHVPGINQQTVQRFKRLGSFAVRGVVLSQPLFMRDATVNNARQPVLIVATSHNDVYAFSPSEARTTPLWHAWLGRPVVSKKPLHPGEDPPPADGAACAPNSLAAWQEDGTLDGLETGLIGIESTPVIDPALGRIFVSYKTFEGLQHVAAISMNDGTVLKSVIVPAPNQEWHKLHRNRTSLVLANGVVFVGYSSLCEGSPIRMHGSISAFDAATLDAVGRYQVTDDNTDGGGIWQGSTGLAADNAGNLYFTTGNRRLCFGVPPGELDQPDKASLASSVVRVHTERTAPQGSEPYHLSMEAADYFTPYRRTMEDCYDLDMSAAGVVLIPGTRYLGAGGKEGVFYVLDRADMGGPETSDPAWTYGSVTTWQERVKHKDSLDDAARDHVRQKFQATQVRWPAGQDYLLNSWMEWPHIHGTPAFASFGNDQFMFLWGEKDKPKRFRWHDGKFELPPLEGEPIAPPYVDMRLNGMPGGFISVNVDPTGGSSGVVFASAEICDEPGYPSCRTSQDNGVLRAYDPFTMRQLWNDTTEPQKYWFSKLVPPTIAGNRVFLATRSGKVLIYGVP
ncbi:hypothetical protein [Bradyrhizobium sp. Ce-3]|uniref:hypothetical protein n=1 Tax=Bradyrhizobium sp. Ce-3 TaxID=2913970 RepID=UPI001FC7F4E5|nr:hypothetical protein [Bradyrhizobium sp. Ce-3]GKQ52627.1 hypothetical protein BRSPCE3_34820 [Bradyrhizobium sp. Ce-3]